MKNKIVVILGSSRSNGNTRKIVNYLNTLDTCIDIVDLNNYNIGYYDYEFKNCNDDFFQLFKSLLTYDTLIFATPIYWYTMSAQLKTFLDRFSDALKGEKKEFGRQLRGKHLAVISCGSDNEIFDGFTMPFIESAMYLGMNYIGHVHTWVEKDILIPNKIKQDINEFYELISSKII